MNIVILGATGFIGSAIAAKLSEASLHTAKYRITGLARNTKRAARKAPQIRWVTADLAKMKQPQDWLPVLTGQDIVINCAGALQDGQADNLMAVQEQSMLALYKATHERPLKLIIQISAQTEGAGSDLPFLATKKHADTALAKSGIPYVILRPGLVLGRNGHGGSALLRAIAALPFVLPLVHADKPVAITAISDIATVVMHAVEGKITSGSDISLTGEDPLTLRDLVILHRHWLGLSYAPVFSIPEWLAHPVTWLADLAGQLGWRSPLRSTAMRIMTGGILYQRTRTDDEKQTLATAGQVLTHAPSGVQDLWFARLYLLKPLIIVTLSLFWVLSGLMPLFTFQTAQSHFTPFMPAWLAAIFTLLSCAADIAVGLMLLYRPFSRRALGLMLALSLIYLFSASLAEPSLWLDPLGSLIKVLPVILLTLTALAILDER